MPDGPQNLISSRIQVPSWCKEWFHTTKYWWETMLQEIQCVSLAPCVLKDKVPCIGKLLFSPVLYLLWSHISVDLSLALPLSMWQFQAFICLTCFWHATFADLPDHFVGCFVSYIVFNKTRKPALTSSWCLLHDSNSTVCVVLFNVE